MGKRRISQTLREAFEKYWDQIFWSSCAGCESFAVAEGVKLLPSLYWGTTQGSRRGKHHCFIGEAFLPVAFNL